MDKNEKLFGSWADPLNEFLESDEFKNIGKTLKQESDSGKTIRPLFDEMFKPFKFCSWDNIKVVFLTNNPYIEDESDGLALSARKEQFQAPKPLYKVFDAVEKDVCKGLYLDRRNDLGRWAKQGVLLLNCDISTIKGKRGVHIELWRPFIQYVMKTLNDKAGVIFCLIGTEASKYIKILDPLSHEIIVVEHPMKAVMEKRDWDHKGLFYHLNLVTNLIFDTNINWTINA